MIAKVIAPRTIEAATWILTQLMKSAPDVRVPWVQCWIAEVLDPDTPAWRRALIAAIAIEALGMVRLKVPVRFILRMIAFQAAFGTQPPRRSAESGASHEAH